ncbi:hypothetical protein QJQ45_017147, partial [Haematococcus lacustris]
RPSRNLDNRASVNDASRSSNTKRNQPPPARPTTRRTNIRSCGRGGSKMRLPDQVSKHYIAMSIVLPVMPCVLVLFDPLQNPLHRQSLGATRFQSGTAVKSSVTAAKAALKTMPPSLVHRVNQQQPVQTKAEATVAAMAPLFSGVTAALSSLAQRGADKHSNGVLHAAVMATQANAVKALEYSGDSSKHFAFLQSCMQQGMAGFGLAMPTATAGAGSSTAQHRVMEEEEEEEEEEVEVVYDSQ